MRELQFPAPNRPILLQPGRFTPLQRTPWAGQTIARRFKNEVFPERVNAFIGESWEFSCDPELPSYILDAGTALPEYIAAYGADVLSPELMRQSGPVCEVLVKLLNAASPLSLQIHPADDDPHLGPTECGKPESWYVLDAEQGAGIYLGFAKPITREELRALVADPRRAKETEAALHFVPVQPGDYFEIAPGVPHAIGPGVTLLEPQRILFGKSGKTYRLWDWGRKYDAAGTEVKAHAPGYADATSRELHLEAGLRLADPQTQVGEAFVATTRRIGQVKRISSQVQITEFSPNAYYQTRMIDFFAEDTVQFSGAVGYGVALCLQGEIDFISESGMPIRMQKGMSALLPYRSFPFAATAKGGTRMALVTPALGNIQVSAQ